MPYGTRVEDSEALSLMSALSQPVRLDAFRLLARAFPDGVASGELAQAIGASANTMSGHLAVLSRAGAVDAKRVGRTIVYTARTKPVQELAAFLSASCGSLGVGKTD